MALLSRRGMRAAVLLLSGAAAAAPASAAVLCEIQPCTARFEFPAGGAIEATGTATLSFGPGGSLQLGDGGSIDLGAGGSILPAPGEGEAPDFAGGGSIVLGAGGALRFGSNGVFDIGDQGQLEVAEGGGLQVSSARRVSVQSPGAVHLGRIASAGAVSLKGGGIADGDLSTPIHFTMSPGDTGSEFEMVSGGPLRFETLQSAGMLVLDANGDIVLGDLHIAPPDGAVPPLGSGSDITISSGVITFGDLGTVPWVIGSGAGVISIGDIDASTIEVLLGGIVIGPDLTLPPLVIGPVIFEPAVPETPQVVVLDEAELVQPPTHWVSGWPRWNRSAQAAPTTATANSLQAAGGTDNSGGGALPPLLLGLLAALRYAARRPRR
ncbi:MAG TPA: hypothetical protein VLI06_15850 [Solimonas sp.]|nr:hypothetical protein [Solimonas sp.]